VPTTSFTSKITKEEDTGLSQNKPSCIWVSKDRKLSEVVGLDPVTVTASIDKVRGSAPTAVSASKSHAAGGKTRSKQAHRRSPKKLMFPVQRVLALAASGAGSHFRGRTHSLKVRISAWFLGDG